MTVRFLAMILAAALMAGTAQAQFGRAEKTQGELAYEEAVANLEKQREQRAEAVRACAQEDYMACSMLGDFYRRGIGGYQDYEKAVTAYRKACSGDRASGCASLAYLYNDGKGVDVDHAQARLFYKKACDLGEVSGCAGYGNLLYIGRGGRRQVHEGTRFLQGACDREYEWACERILELGAFDPEDDTYERLKEWKTRTF